jgi:16S rRNA C967 or C1407 C5-methylase (RsmB/RsmF family)/NOL1/NOP2/fmu family ribosome biogenesis protein
MELPDLFVKRMHDLLADEAEGVLKALEEEPVVSVRLNPAKCAFGCAGDSVPWATDGFYLDERRAFTFDPLFHAGCYYVQEASSMFLEQVVRQYIAEPVTALDLCAAPGGKSTLLRSVLPEGSLLVSNEVIPARAQVLMENMVKWGHPDGIVTSGTPADFGALPSFFDVIVADVPCSGEGMFRKDPVAVAEWSEENVETCWRRSRGIIADCWEALKEGGLLVYSTCTFNLKEDEENVRWICEELGAEALQLKTLPEWGITGNLQGEADSFPVYRFLPGRTRGEGFFLAVLRKLSAPKASMPQKQKNRPNPKAQPIPQECKKWLCDADPYEWKSEKNTIVALSERCVAAFPALAQHVKVLYAGVAVAEWKGRDVVPTTSLALSNVLCREAFSIVEVSYSEALAYLRKEALTLSSDAPRGYVLLTFRGVPLGFVKNVGNRANNLYPSEWRIRTTHLPDSEVRVLC